MHVINTLDEEIEILTYNVGDALQWVPFKHYKAPPGSRIYVQAHDAGRCKLRAAWPHGGRELGVHGEDSVLAVTPPTLPPRYDREHAAPMEPDDVRNFLIEHWEKTNWFRVELPTPRQPQGGDPQPS